MKLKLVFDDWQDRSGKSIYQSEKGIDLSMGSFHGGTTFDAEIELDEEEEEEILVALAEGFRPVFYVISPLTNDPRKAIL